MELSNQTLLLVTPPLGLLLAVLDDHVAWLVVLMAVLAGRLITDAAFIFHGGIIRLVCQQNDSIIAIGFLVFADRADLSEWRVFTWNNEGCIHGVMVVSILAGDCARGEVLVEGVHIVLSLLVALFQVLI